MILPAKAFLASVPILVSLYASRWKREDEQSTFPSNPEDFSLPAKEVFDFIVVGGGAAGCVLANRLSENYSVLLLEAGGRPPPLASVPALVPIISSHSDINFHFRSTPQRNVVEGQEDRLSIITGKMLGGGGSRNHMIWEQGHPLDYDQWANVSRDDSWRYENILKYFKKIENYNGNSTKCESDGPCGKISISKTLAPLGLDIFFRGGQELGYDIRESYQPQSIGVKSIYFATRNGERESSYTAYLKPIMKTRSNLKVYTYSFVSKVIFEDTNKAVGVTYERHGVPRVAFASKEIILSSGSIITPIILFKSGIGPLDQVKAAKATEHVMELPVGQNLQDHAYITVGPFFVNDPKLSWTLERNLTVDDITNYTKFRQGPLTSSLHGGVAFISSHGKLQTTEKWPDIQMYHKPDGSEPRSLGCMITNGRPFSRGVLKINESAVSMEDNNLPLLDYKYFEHPADYDVTIAAIDFCLELFEKTKSFQNVGAHLSLDPFKPCQHIPLRSREYWKCYIRHNSNQGFHSSGTCRMGYGKDDPLAVVDSKLRVIGVRSLRVVDASIMPFITNANTHAPTVLIAEKAADDILNDHANSTPGI